MNDWQPIETAPKDGCRVDLWVCADSILEGSRVASCRFMNGSWVRLVYGAYEPVVRYARITHWMPLPAPPKDENGTK